MNPTGAGASHFPSRTRRGVSRQNSSPIFRAPLYATSRGPRLPLRLNDLRIGGVAIILVGQLLEDERNYVKMVGRDGSRESVHENLGKNALKQRSGFPR